MLTFTQLRIMLELQESMNATVHFNWRDQNFPFHRALWMESSELLDHYGWKWWKQQTPDLPQLHLELVDIFHFGLSILLSKFTIDDCITYINDRWSDPNMFGCSFETLVESLVSETITYPDEFFVDNFSRLTHKVGLTTDKLYTMYIGKNVLNTFRQDNGYKEGTYQKVWNGQEDNEHLVNLMELLDPSSEDFIEDVYKALKDRYNNLCN